MDIQDTAVLTIEAVDYFLRIGSGRARLGDVTGQECFPSYRRVARTEVPYLLRKSIFGLT